MKRFAKLFVVAVIVTLIASMFVVEPAALEPADLQVTNDNVVFIMDAPEGGQLPGDGTGKDAQNPYQPIDHEGYDPEADAPKQYLNTAFYQATEMLRSTGGTIVFCGPVHLGPEDTWGVTAATTRDVLTARFGTNTIKFTSVYNGVDYRETNGAKLTIETPAEICLNGQTIWENIDIETIGTDRVISCNYFLTRFGEGINCYPKEEAFAAVPTYYVSVSGGHRYEGGIDKTTNILIQSGTYNVVTAAIWGVTNQRKINDDGTTNWTYNNDGSSVAKLTLEGTTKILGQVYGTTRKASEFSGITEIIINGGTYDGDIFGIGPTGMLNKDGVCTIKINGGEFKNCWTLSPVTEGYLNNAPAASLLDFSGWKGEEASLAAAYNLAKNAGFTSIKLPEGADADKLAAMTVAPATEDLTPVTLPSGNGNETAAPGGNGGIIIGGDDDETTPESTGTSNVDVNDDKGGMSMGLILGIVGGVVVIALIVVIAVMASKMKKLAAAPKTEETKKED